MLGRSTRPIRMAVAVGAAFVAAAALTVVSEAGAGAAPNELAAPPFTGAANPIPAEPATFDPSHSMLQAIFDADVAAGGESYWFDRILARPFRDTSSGERSLMTRGRALYMYTHNPSVLGFAGQGTGANGGGGYAYRQPPTTSVVNLYTIAVSGDALTETTARRVQTPRRSSSPTTTWQSPT
jgi:hypothetical protein